MGKATRTTRSAWRCRFGTRYVRAARVSDWSHTSLCVASIYLHDIVMPWSLVLFHLTEPQHVSCKCSIFLWCQGFWCPHVFGLTAAIAPPNGCMRDTPVQLEPLLCSFAPELGCN